MGSIIYMKRIILSIIMVAVLCINISACQRPDNTTSKTGITAKSNQKRETKTEEMGDDREAKKENTEERGNKKRRAQMISKRYLE